MSGSSPYSVVVAPEAVLRLEETLRYLRETGASRAREQLLVQVATALEQLAEFPYLGIASRIAGARRLILSPRFWLLYQLDDAARAVEVLGIFDNRRA